MAVFVIEPQSGIFLYGLILQRSLILVETALIAHGWLLARVKERYSHWARHDPGI